ncbi:MAG: hypothetical protein O9296_17215, partial [Novosphingobium sp.]|nr:hypothetical protein [Novosphingobium sp.]
TLVFQLFNIDHAFQSVAAPPLKLQSFWPIFGPNIGVPVMPVRATDDRLLKANVKVIARAVRLVADSDDCGRRFRSKVDTGSDRSWTGFL